MARQGAETMRDYAWCLTEVNIELFFLMRPDHLR